MPVRASDDIAAVLSPLGAGRQKKQKRQQRGGSPQRFRGVAEGGDDSDSLLTDEEGLEVCYVVPLLGRL